MKDVKTIEDALVKMREKVKDLQGMTDAVTVVNQLEELFDYIDDVTKMPPRLQLIVYAAAAVLIEYLIAEGVFKQCGNITENVKENVESLLNDIIDKYGNKLDD